MFGERLDGLGVFRIVGEVVDIVGVGLAVIQFDGRALGEGKVVVLADRGVALVLNEERLGGATVGVCMDILSDESHPRERQRASGQVSG